MGAESFGRGAARRASFGRACSGLRAPNLKATPPFSWPSSSAAPVSCLSFPPSLNANDPVSLFQSLLFEAAGRTVNPVNGAVGLLWTGNWHVCQAAVETVLRGGALRSIPEFLGENPSLRELDESSEAEVTCTGMLKLQDPCKFSKSKVQKRRRIYEPEQSKALPTADLDLSLTAAFPAKKSPEKRRSVTPSLNSEESGTTSCLESGIKVHAQRGGEPKLLNFF
ncbi:hypothetical protein RJ640_030556 [Escallonia rubra]|uniref:LOB domain-containing protein n=1 Tax=Escallonia rubra TaxID=112253 RepID=A0AA88R985_9ASTE|nr:hypothetical protein RJ640_030556 [Escallonia rubra]